MVMTRVQLAAQLRISSASPACVSRRRLLKAGLLMFLLRMSRPQEALTLTKVMMPSLMLRIRATTPVLHPPTAVLPKNFKTSVYFYLSNLFCAILIVVR